MTDRSLRQIAFYGKGGVGKSTVVSNLAVALVKMGRKVMVVGCNPKGDSTALLNGGEMLPLTILDQHREVGLSEETIKECFVKNHLGIILAEAGGPVPAEGCAGRGVSVALDYIMQYEIPKKLSVDFIIYDVVGDVVCGGFAQPIRAGYASNIYIVTSGEMMSLYAANNIATAVKEIARITKAVIGLSGIVANLRGLKREREELQEFSSLISTPILAFIDRSDTVQEAEAMGKTVVEALPNSPLSIQFMKLAELVISLPQKVDPTPITLERLMELLRKYEVME